MWIFCRSTLLTVTDWAYSLSLCLSRSGETPGVATAGWPRSHWCWWALPSSLPATCSCATPASPPAMAMSSDPACERLDPDSDKQSSSLTDTMAAMTTEDSDGSATNGVRNGGAQAQRTHPLRPHVTGRKLSLQERGTYLSSGSGRGYAHTSPRVARRPTVESKRVSISDSQVRKPFLFILISNHYIIKKAVSAQGVIGFALTAAAAAISSHWDK